jgi:hypothetical protein
MLTKDQITIATSVLHVLQQEGATFSSGMSADEAALYLVEIDADAQSTLVEFRDEAACFSIQLANDELANSPAECIDRAMTVRRALVNMSSN